MPIVRKGITATSLQLDFNNEPKFLIDAAIYGGSSGSPVYIFNQGSYSPANGGLVAGTRLKLIGIVYAAALTPSAKNRQPWKYVVYTGRITDCCQSQHSDFLTLLIPFAL